MERGSALHSFKDLDSLVPSPQEGFSLADIGTVHRLPDEDGEHGGCEGKKKS